MEVEKKGNLAFQGDENTMLKVGNLGIIFGKC